jgi:competence protein ComEC
LHNLLKERQEVTLRGVLATSPSIDKEKSRLLLDVNALLFPNTNSNNQAPFTKNSNDTPPPGFIKSSGRIQLALKGPPPDYLSPGDQLLIRATASLPIRYGTPGSFDYPAFLEKKSISATGWIRSPLHIAKVTPDSSQTLLHRLRYGPEKIRHGINQFLKERFPNKTGSMFSAILTGDKSSVPSDLLENFKSTGTMHLLAISGLHMGLLAVCISFSCNWLIKRSQWLLLNTQAWKLAVLFTLPVLIFYALIAGFQIPVVRSLIMTSVFLLSVLFDRQWHIPTNIAIAVFIILLIYPLSLFTASFQLSFTAVVGLAVFMPRIKSLLFFQQKQAAEQIKSKVWSWIVAGLLVSCVATIATFPLTIFYFHRFSPLSPITTLLVEPLLCIWSLLIGLISCPFIFFSQETAEFLLHIGSVGIYGADYVTNAFAQLPFCTIWLSTPTLFEIALYYLLLVSLSYFKRSTVARTIALLCIMILVAIPVYAKTTFSRREFDTVNFLDIGHGNCVVVELANGDITIIDGGGAKSDKFNVGEMIIAPYLWKKRVKKIKSIIVSHSDADHYNGLDFILKNFTPDTLWLNSKKGDGKDFNDLIKHAEELNVEIRIPEAGETLLQHEETRINNLTNLHITPGIGKDNNKSLVIKVSSKRLNFLLTGDIEESAEEQLISQVEDLHANVLLAPHHGSATSSSMDFLQAVAPEYTVISAGKLRPYTFPSPKVIKRYQQIGSKVFNTARDGTITFQTKDGEIKISTFKGVLKD